MEIKDRGASKLVTPQMVQTAPGAGQCGPPYGVKWAKGLNVLTDTKQTIETE